MLQLGMYVLNFWTDKHQMFLDGNFTVVGSLYLVPVSNVFSFTVLFINYLCSCMKCNGKGMIPCATCGSRGLIKCRTCDGSGSLLTRSVAIVRW